MTLSIGSVAPDFTAETTQGTINFHDWIGDSYAILFSHPKDYTPVCTTELGYMAGLADDFAKRNTKIIGLSVDKVGDHEGWSRDIKDVSGNEVNFPMIGDHDLKVAKLYNMLPADAGDTWEKISGNPGFASGLLGRIGVAASPAKPGRLWALVEAIGEEGGVYRSEDSGQTWEHVSRERSVQGRPPMPSTRSR